MKPCAWFSLVIPVFTMLALSTTVFAQPPTVPHELAQRLAGADATLYVGELPPEEFLGFDLPQPPRTRVVGANVWTGTDPSYNTLYFSSRQHIDDVKAFYRRVFRDLGWRAGAVYQQTGFLPSGGGEAVDSMAFCRSQGDSQTDVYLTLSSQPRATWIDAQVSTYDSSQGSGACDNAGYHGPPIPRLEAPTNSETGTLENLSGGEQGNGGSVIALRTSLNPRELHEHYATQLELSGWREDATADGGAVRLATYRFRDQGEAFIGTLQVMPLGQEGRYLAQVTVVNP